MPNLFIVLIPPAGVAMILILLLFPQKIKPLSAGELAHLREEESHDPFHHEVKECGILWRAYDVRREGLERFSE